MPNSRFRRQFAFQSQFAWTLSLYGLPIMWNRWTYFVITPTTRFKFKVRTKIVFINKYLRGVMCEYRKSPNCFFLSFIATIIINNVVYQLHNYVDAHLLTWLIRLSSNQMVTSFLKVVSLYYCCCSYYCCYIFLIRLGW